MSQKFTCYILSFFCTLLRDVLLKIQGPCLIFWNLEYAITPGPSPKLFLLNLHSYEAFHRSLDSSKVLTGHKVSLHPQRRL